MAGTGGMPGTFLWQVMVIRPVARLGGGPPGPAGGDGDGPERLEWAEVVQRYADVVYTMAYRLTADDEEARDLAQDVMLRLHRGLRRYRRGNFEGWLYRTTLNVFRDRLRKSKRRREEAWPEHAAGDGGPVAPDAPGAEVEEEVQRAEVQRVVQQALIQLPPNYREAVVLRDFEGRSYDEIARILEIPLGTVRSRIHRGREALRDLLEPHVGTGS